MERKNYKRSKLLLWGGTLLLITVLLYVALAALEIGGISTISYLGYLIEESANLFNINITLINYQHDFTQLFYVVLGASIFLNLVLGLVLTKMSKLTENKQVLDKLVPLIFIMLISFVLPGLGPIAALLILIAIIKGIYDSATAKPDTNYSNKKIVPAQETEQKLNKAKQLLDKGIISKEEYKNLTKDLIDANLSPEDKVVNDIAKLKKLKSDGVITEEEYKILIQKLF